MPTVALKLSSGIFKLMLRYRFDRAGEEKPYRSDSMRTPPNGAFVDGVASKDVAIGESGLAVRMFLPDVAVQAGTIHTYSWMVRKMATKVYSSPVDQAGHFDLEGDAAGAPAYKGYIPKETPHNHRLPVIVQFHMGGFVLGSKDTVANDAFCRRIARVCNSIVVAVDYRLAPEHRYPAAADDGYEVLRWLGRQALLIQSDSALNRSDSDSQELREVSRSLMTSEAVDPWLAMHADVSRVVLLGASAGANIADQVARRASTPQSAVELDPVNVKAQVLLYPLFTGATPTPSEVQLNSSSLFFDRRTIEFVWRLYLPKDSFSLDHPAANPLIKGECPAGMPPTLTITAEIDLTKDRILAYNAFLRRLGVEAQNLDYKDTVHGFATMDPLINTPQAEGCAEDVALWIHKHLSPRGGELSY